MTNAGSTSFRARRYRFLECRRHPAAADRALVRDRVPGCAGDRAQLHPARQRLRLRHLARRCLRLSHLARRCLRLSGLGMARPRFVAVWPAAPGRTQSPQAGARTTNKGARRRAGCIKRPGASATRNPAMRWSWWWCRGRAIWAASRCAARCRRPSGRWSGRSSSSTRWGRWSSRRARASTCGRTRISASPPSPTCSTGAIMHRDSLGTDAGDPARRR